MIQFHGQKHCLQLNTVCGSNKPPVINWWHWHRHQGATMRLWCRTRSAKGIEEGGTTRQFISKMRSARWWEGKRNAKTIVPPILTRPFASLRAVARDMRAQPSALRNGPFYYHRTSSGQTQRLLKTVQFNICPFRLSRTIGNRQIPGTVRGMRWYFPVRHYKYVPGRTVLSLGVLQHHWSIHHVYIRGAAATASHDDMALSNGVLSKRQSPRQYKSTAF